MKDAKGHGSNARGSFQTLQDQRRNFTNIEQRQGATSRGVTNTVRERQAILAGIDNRRYGLDEVTNALRSAPLGLGAHSLAVHIATAGKKLP
jgi:hypothetical protein